jgi:hypothetical protein
MLKGVKPIAPAPVDSKPSVEYGVNPEGRPGTTGEYRKPKDLYDPGKVDRGPPPTSTMGAGGAAGNEKPTIGEKPLPPRRVPAGRLGYNEQNPDGSWDFVYSNTGRRVSRGGSQAQKQGPAAAGPVERAKEVAGPAGAGGVAGITGAFGGFWPKLGQQIYDSLTGTDKLAPSDPSKAPGATGKASGSAGGVNKGKPSQKPASPQPGWLRGLRTGAGI